MTARALNWLRRTAHPVASAAELRMVARSRGAALNSALGLRRAGTTTQDVIVGPFLGEVGFELLYWVPFLRRILGSLAIVPERVIAVTRGGAGPWYDGVAGRVVDVSDLLGETPFREALEDRRRTAGDSKMLTVEDLDRSLLALAQNHVVSNPVVVHPVLMYARMRSYWEGKATLGDAVAQLEYAPLPRGPRPPQAPPGEYVALKAYYSAAFPRKAGHQRSVADVARSLAEHFPVVVLNSGGTTDGHEEWEDAGLRDVLIHAPAQLAESLGSQTAYTAHARALVCVYGGFSYLGPLLDVPTIGFYSEANFNTRHLDLAQAGLPSRLEVEPLEDAGPIVNRVLALPAAGRRSAGVVR